MTATAGSAESFNERGGEHMPKVRHVAALCSMGMGVASLGVFSMAAGAGAAPPAQGAPGGVPSGGASIANTENINVVHGGTCSPVQTVQTGNIINANGNGSGNGGAAAGGAGGSGG